MFDASSMTSSVDCRLNASQAFNKAQGFNCGLEAMNLLEFTAGDAPECVR
jgi:hypothetical protein